MQVRLESSKGDFKNIERMLKRYAKLDTSSSMQQIGNKVVSTLASNTPVDSSELRNGWQAITEKTSSGTELAIINNSHPETPTNLAVMLEYGHYTGTGGWVPANPFIKRSVNGMYKAFLKQLNKELSNNG